MNFDPQAFVSLGKVQVLFLQEFQIRRIAVEDVEGAIFLVHLLHFGLGRTDHGHFAQFSKTLGAPSFAPNQLQLVHIRYFGMVALILRHLAFLIKREVGKFIVGRFFR